MKIAHICLSCFYIDGFSYQENELVKEHVRSGHDVIVIASTENYVNAQLSYVQPVTYNGADGATVIRLPYSSFLPHKVMTKLRMHPNLYEKLQAFDPDVIVFHGLCGWELRTVCKYKINNPKVKLWVDSHEDQNNSARTFGSKLLHNYFYRPVIQSVLQYIDIILCISLDTIEFVAKTYSVPRDKLHFFPLGAKIYNDDDYESIRKVSRERYGLNANDILFIQTGKQNKRKKLIDSLNAFLSTSNSNFKFFIIGSLSEDISTDALTLIEQDDRISYLGWKDSDELQQLLCAADIYLQPGTQSATMQMALGARCAVIVDDVLSHQPFVKANGWLINERLSLEDIMNTSKLDVFEIESMQENSHQIASNLLDYRKQAAFLLSF
ncbi:glycosyltransferase family 4 protein [Rheinheimera fenheensis]|uniref:glycosyltransferase family 4 protein n=1 Tax=Rheinheimera fenheensis TaxID=3152295 RepID=UPI00325F7A77